MSNRGQLSDTCFKFGAFFLEQLSNQWSVLKLSILFLSFLMIIIVNLFRHIEILITFISMSCYLILLHYFFIIFFLKINIEITLKGLLLLRTVLAFLFLEVSFNSGLRLHLNLHLTDTYNL